MSMESNVTADVALSRRAWLRKLGGGLGLVGIAPLLHERILAAESVHEIAGAARSLRSVTHFAPRAKRMIQLFMNGEPFPADLFDPKPAASKRGRCCPMRDTATTIKRQPSWPNPRPRQWPQWPLPNLPRD